MNTEMLLIILSFLGFIKSKDVCIETVIIDLCRVVRKIVAYLYHFSTSYLQTQRYTIKIHARKRCINKLTNASAIRRKSHRAGVGTYSVRHFRIYNNRKDWSIHVLN